LEHVLKIFDRNFEVQGREKVKIDNMQFGFKGSKGTTDAIFIVRQLQNKYIAKKQGLEKAFDRVPREVVWWALRSLDVDGWLVSVVQ